MPKTVTEENQCSMETIKSYNKLDIILLFLTAQYENRLTRSINITRLI